MFVPKRSTVVVYDERCEIYVYQKSKTVWIVDGSYNGHSFEAKGPSQSSAIARWKRYAERSDD